VFEFLHIMLHILHLWHFMTEARDTEWLTRPWREQEKLVLHPICFWSVPPDTCIGEEPNYNYLDLEPNFLLLVYIRYFFALF